MYVEDRGVLGATEQELLPGVAVGSQRGQEAWPVHRSRQAGRGAMSCRPPRPGAEQVRLSATYSDTSCSVATAGTFPFQKRVALSDLRVSRDVRTGHVTVVPL